MSKDKIKVPETKPLKFSAFTGGEGNAQWRKPNKEEIKQVHKQYPKEKADFYLSRDWLVLSKEEKEYRNQPIFSGELFNITYYKPTPEEKVQIEKEKTRIEKLIDSIRGGSETLNENHQKEVLEKQETRLEKIRYLKNLLNDIEPIKRSSKGKELYKTYSGWLDREKRTFAREKRITAKEQEKILTPLSDTELENIFNVSKFDTFRKLEQRLFGRSYFNEKRKWECKAPELVAMILMLKDARYFKNSATDKQIKDFFQERYQIDIRQQFKPCRRPDADKHKEALNSIINNL